jgi:hypothetical protein
MPVELYVGRDPQGREWAPDFTHEADAAIRIAGKAWRAFHAGRELFLLAFNLHSPNIDILVVSERGIGLVEMKSHHGKITIDPDGGWFADGQRMAGFKVIPGRDLSPASYLNPHSQVQGHGDRLQERLLPLIGEDYPGLTRGKRRNLRMQTCVCFTNPEAELSEIRKMLPEWNRGRRRPWESDFSVVTTEEIPEWMSALRFEVKTMDIPPYFPFRLEMGKQRPLLLRLFEVERWKNMERMLPVNRFGKLQQVRGDRTLASFSLWEEETFLGRDPLKCTIVAPEQCTKVSRMHAVIRRELEGTVLEDLSSHNGTYLDGTRVIGKVVLRDKTAFTLGGVSNSEKECGYTFQEIGQEPEDVDTTEDGTKPQDMRKLSPAAKKNTPEAEPPPDEPPA